MNIMNIAILLVHAYQKAGDAMEWRAVSTAVMKQTVVSLGYHKTRILQRVSYLFRKKTIHYFYLDLHLLVCVDCVWTDWKPGQCSVTCGLGIRIDTRSKLIEEKNRGTCLGESSITSECQDQTCSGHIDRVLIFWKYFFIIFDWITNHIILFLFFWTISLDEDYIESELIEYIDYIDHQFTSANMSGPGEEKNTTNKSNNGTSN